MRCIVECFRFSTFTRCFDLPPDLGQTLQYDRDCVSCVSGCRASWRRKPVPPALHRRMERPRRVAASQRFLVIAAGEDRLNERRFLAVSSLGSCGPHARNFSPRSF
jgi:hypothetical protein